MANQYVAVIYRPGKAWQSGTDFQEQPGIMEHVGFLKEQFQKGTLKAGGPFLDNAGGLSIFETSDTDALVSDIENDPTIVNDLLTFEMHPVAFPFER